MTPADGVDATRPEPARQRKSSGWRELPVLIIVAVGLALLIKTFFVQAFFIPSGSMEPTLHGCSTCSGDRVLVNKLSTRVGHVQRGQIVVFRDPGGWLNEYQVVEPANPLLRGVRKGFEFIGLLPSANEQDLIKRVIGVGGDKVACCTAGRLTVNGVPLREPYLFPHDPPSATRFAVTVPAGHLWVMGDHRSASADSRAHLDQPDHGMVPEGNVVGHAVLRIWPARRFATLPVPATFHQSALATGAIPADVAVPLAGGAVVVLPVLAVGRRHRRRRSGGRPDQR